MVVWFVCIGKWLSKTNIQKQLKAKHNMHWRVGVPGTSSLKNGYNWFLSNRVARWVCVLLDSRLYPFLSESWRDIPVFGYCPKPKHHTAQHTSLHFLLSQGFVGKERRVICWFGSFNTAIARFLNRSGIHQWEPLYAVQVLGIYVCTFPWPYINQNTAQFPIWNVLHTQCYINQNITRFPLEASAILNAGKWTWNSVLFITCTMMHTTSYMVCIVFYCVYGRSWVVLFLSSSFRIDLNSIQPFFAPGYVRPHSQW